MNDTIPTPLAADGLPTPPPAATFGQFVLTLDNGALHHTLSDDLRDINAALNQHVMDHGGEPKAELTLKIKFKLERGAFRISAARAVKMPDPPPATAILWSTADNKFTPANPAQMQLFGVRDLS